MTNSAKLSLGTYVVALPRADGTHRVLFKVPPSLRPSGWSATIPLPVLGGRNGDLTDDAEVARIQADAARLYKEFLAASGKGGETAPAANSRDVETCIRFWQGSQSWKDNTPTTNEGYDYGIRKCKAWAKALGNPAVDRITVQDVEQFLGLYDDRPSARYEIRKVLRMILNEGERAGWIATGRNPAALVVAPKPKTKAVLWTGADVKRHADHYRQLGHLAVAGIILTEWEIGQRLTDVVLFRHKADYAKGAFSFRQSKTDERVTIPVSQALQEIIEECRVEDSPYLFHDAGTGRPFPDVNRLGHVFGDNRPEGSTLWLRALRHTCVVELARAGCTVPEITSITGHTLASAHTILQTYLPRDSEVATNAQKKRGLI